MKPLDRGSPEMILASGSPRRLELTQRIGFRPIVRVSDVEEALGFNESPSAYARRLARDKARAVEKDLGEDQKLPGWILAADTIVVVDGEVLEKPGDQLEALAMLTRLSGRKHTVITAFCWIWRGLSSTPRQEEVVDVQAEVWMRSLSESFLRRYVATGEPMDKAGSYGIQDVGSTLVRRIDGSYFCVVGLPVCEVVETLEAMGGLDDYPFLPAKEEF